MNLTQFNQLILIMLNYVSTMKKWKQYALSLVFFAMMIIIVTACQTNTSTHGFWQGKLSFSNAEELTIDLELKTDSSFIFIKQLNNGEPGQAFFGNWQTKKNKIVLNGDSNFQLLLDAKPNKLQVLDYEGNEVIGSKKLELIKQPQIKSFSQQFVAQAEFTYFADASSIRFGNLKTNFPVLIQDDHAAAERILFNNRTSDEMHSILLKGVFSFVTAPDMEGTTREHVIIHKAFEK